MNELLEPWSEVPELQRVALETELHRELSPDHILAGKSARAVARRFDRDDVLFEVAGLGFAVVHLTYSKSRETSPKWPSTELFASFAEWRERRMQTDYDAF
ncbi:MAG TPA: hypothetical protein VGH63_18090 [Polyangia bacterium]|jgi:hypothetical protein